jgi:hypothetical protein
MKILEFEALDGSKWHIPASVVAESYKGHYLNEPESDAELVEWARGDMNWTDVRAHAVMVEQPDPLDMEDSWANGKMRVLAGQDRTEAAKLVGGIVLTQEQVDALALSVKVGEVLTRDALLAIYHGMKDDAATILAGVEPGDHGDAIIAAFGERAARIGIMKAVGLAS